MHLASHYSKACDSSKIFSNMEECGREFFSPVTTSTSYHLLFYLFLTIPEQYDILYLLRSPEGHIMFFRYSILCLDLSVGCSNSFPHYHIRFLVAHFLIKWYLYASSPVSQQNGISMLPVQLHLALPIFSRVGFSFSIQSIKTLILLRGPPLNLRNPLFLLQASSNSRPPLHSVKPPKKSSPSSNKEKKEKSQVDVQNLKQAYTCRKV